jgi:hypothetical protein
MAERSDQQHLSPQELRRRVIGLSFEHDRQDVVDSSSSWVRIMAFLPPW